MENVMTNTNNFGFCELNENEKAIINGGEILAIIVGGVVSYLVYECANAACEDFTGKTIGKHLADWLFPV